MHCRGRNYWVSEPLLGILGSREHGVKNGQEEGAWGKNNREQGDDEMEFRCYLGSMEK